ncbi:hypothetical protein B9Z43_01430 [Limnohabitans sp. MMS-10A-192]|uniref:gp53-like domain-containing protein n=1 Tax=Limnohabitans sp. MMS-10A-192 TaxID=1835769 RepID=UPI000D36F952|nr:hypothetical protein [Limnohabitans sp. MMS-10A-192]PUE21869.1 hypothetical protein B9Z43_01430 [Limnohabitans sp. MMS-10A-192]
MASLPESSTFDAGVYQLELTDPVIGGPSGVSNAPLKNLANRTKYLKDHVDALEATRAPLASPALTGSPTAPTAAQGTSTTQLATTAFVQAEIAADAAPKTHVGATGSAHGTATSSAAGFMSAADKSKLDGVGSGANVASVDGATGAVSLAALDAFGRNLTGSGYQKLPGGMIIQWVRGMTTGLGNTFVGSSTPSTLAITASFPLAFSQIYTASMFADGGNGIEGGEIIISGAGYTTSQIFGTVFRVAGSNSGLGNENIFYNVIAIGKI